MAQLKSTNEIYPGTRVTALLLISVFLLLPFNALAQKVLLVGTVNQPLHQKILAGMHDRLQILNVQGIEIEQVSKDALNQSLAAAGKDLLIVTIGTENTVAALRQNPIQPLLSIAIPRLNYDALKPAPGSASARGQFSALVLDQPLSRRLNLIQQVLPGAQRIGLALGEETSAYTQEIESEAMHHNLKIQSSLVQHENELIDALDDILEHSDALLGLLDPVVFNRSNSRNILLTAYRWRVPLFGISSAYVRAGALAAVFTEPEQIGWQLAETIVQYEKNGPKTKLPAYLYPRYFEVAVNYQVAESMGLQIDREAKLKRKLIEHED